MYYTHRLLECEPQFYIGRPACLINWVWSGLGSPTQHMGYELDIINTRLSIWVPAAGAHWGNSHECPSNFHINILPHVTQQTNNHAIVQQITNSILLRHTQCINIKILIMGWVDIIKHEVMNPCMCPWCAQVSYKGWLHHWAWVWRNQHWSNN